MTLLCRIRVIVPHSRAKPIIPLPFLSGLHSMAHWVARKAVRHEACKIASKSLESGHAHLELLLLRNRWELHLYRTGAVQGFRTCYTAPSYVITLLNRINSALASSAQVLRHLAMAASLLRMASSAFAVLPARL
jgi:hypothetical protein